jgi:hypothetical protein
MFKYVLSAAFAKECVPSDLILQFQIEIPLNDRLMHSSIWLLQLIKLLLIRSTAKAKRKHALSSKFTKNEKSYLLFKELSKFCFECYY